VLLPADFDRFSPEPGAGLTGTEALEVTAEPSAGRRGAQRRDRPPAVLASAAGARPHGRDHEQLRGALAGLRFERDVQRYLLVRRDDLEPGRLLDLALGGREVPRVHDL